MNGQLHRAYSRLADAGAALLVSGFDGAAVGATASVAISVLFVGPGAVYIALWGALSGFCAATCGAALGGRAGWPASGAFWGAYGGYNLMLFLSRVPGAASTSGSGLAALLVVATAGFGGYLLGELARGLQERPNSRLTIIEGANEQTGLPSYFRLPLPLRFGLAICQMLPVLVCVPTEIGRVSPAWSGFAG